MRAFATICMAAAVLVGASQTEGAIVLFDAGEPSGTGHWISYKFDSNRAPIYDDFSLPTPATLTGITFWSLEADASWDGRLEYYIHTDEGGLPTVAPLVHGDATDIVREDSGRGFPGFPGGTEYEYSFSIEDPLVLPGDSVYWLGLYLGSADSSGALFWSITQNGFGANAVRATFSQGVPTWQQLSAPNAQNVAFQLSGPSTPPVAEADGPYTLWVGDPLILNASGSVDLDGQIVSYMWDLDNNGSFETDTGDQPFFVVDYGDLQDLGLAAGGMYDIHLKVTDNTNLTDTDSSSLRIVPEPATLSLLALGSLVALRRRRR